MKVLITGGAGMLGMKLARALLARGTLKNAQDQSQPISELVLLDIMPPAAPLQDARVKHVTGDAGDATFLQGVLGSNTEAVFHLAAVVSGQAEADFDLGMRVNVDGTRTLLEALRKQHAAGGPKARVLFSSSIAIYGTPLPPAILDDTIPTPQASYGVQKLIGEWLVADFNRKGFIDGRSVRLPTISVRPGKANAAASSFASAIIREPLNGIDYACPVGPDVQMWMLSPRKAIEYLVQYFELTSAAIGPLRSVNLPGIVVSVGEMAESLKRVGGAAPAARVRFAVDEKIMAIVKTWAYKFDTTRAKALGFVPDADMDAIVRAYIEEEGIKL
jgi:D-erythronate 2-dehydrogenase